MAAEAREYYAEVVLSRRRRTRPTVYVEGEGLRTVVGDFVSWRLLLEEEIVSEDRVDVVGRVRTSGLARGRGRGSVEMRGKNYLR